MKLSVILPTYNEAENIIQLIKEILRNIPADYDYEIIVVDDSSPDNTYLAVVNTFQANPRIKAVLRTTDRGFAKSIHCGIENASGDQVLIMDTDFTHDPGEIPKMLHVSLIYDIVSCSRFCPGGHMESLRHYLASLIYNWLIRIILGTQIQDNLGGYFIVNRNKLLALPLNKIFYGYGEYFFRLLHYAQIHNMSIVEIPAIYHTRKKGRSKSNFIRLLIKYTSAVIKLKIETIFNEKHSRFRNWQLPS